MKSFPGRTQFKNADCGIIFNTLAHMVLTSTFELKIIHRKNQEVHDIKSFDSTFILQTIPTNEK